MDISHLTPEVLKAALIASLQAAVPLTPEGWQRDDMARDLAEASAMPPDEGRMAKSIELFRVALRELPEPDPDYEGVMADHRRLVRRLDVALNGEGAAPQASLCDVVGQVEAEGIRSRNHKTAAGT